MSFLHPAFLWALTALSIPVLIHLFQLRRFKRVDFPDVRLLAELAQQTRQRKRVRQWLLLLTRMLALACLVLAFAQPYLPGDAGAVTAGQRAVSIFIDDSYSMDGRNPSGRLLDQARKGAQDVVMAHAATDRFQVLTGAFAGRQQVLQGRDEALEAISQADVTPFSRTLSKVLARQREALAASGIANQRAFVLTDLQRSAIDLEALTDDATIPTFIIPLPAGAADNLSIDSVWFESPVHRAGRNEALHVRIRNHGGTDVANVPMRLTIGGQPRAIATFGVEAGATTDTVVRFLSTRPGSFLGEVSITDQPVTFDDRTPFSFHVTREVRVLLVGDAHPASDRAIAAVFATDSVYTLSRTSHRSVNIAALAGQDLVVLNALPEVPSGLAQGLAAFVAQGGSLVFFPPYDGDPAGSATLFAQLGLAPPARTDTGLVRVDRIDLEQPFFRQIFLTMPRNVDLPESRQRWHLQPPPGSETPLRAQDGRPFLARVPHGRGTVHLWAAPLDERGSNLTRHALFATALLRCGELARPMGPLYHTIGAEFLTPLEGVDIPADRVPEIHGPEGLRLVPEVRRGPQSVALALPGEELLPGGYHVLLGNDTLAAFAMVPPRHESDLSAFTPAELKAALEARGLSTFSVIEAPAGDLSLRLNELGRGRKLWKWFVLAALLCLTAEVFLMRPKP